jgi:hypothetical protein
MTAMTADIAEAAAIASGLSDAVRRTCLAIERETLELKASGAIDFAGHRHRKDICLLDLMRRGRALGDADPGPEVRATLRRLRDAIIDNQSALRVHLNASRQVTKILIDVMVDAESDRTYGREFARRSDRA